MHFWLNSICVLLPSTCDMCNGNKVESNVIYYIVSTKVRNDFIDPRGNCKVLTRH